MNLKERAYSIWNQYTYYIMVGVVSLVASFFLPMLGSSMDGGFQFPTDTSGWIVFLTTKLASAFMNVLLLVLFVNQGKLNVRNDQKYLDARKILEETEKKRRERAPRSPATYHRRLYEKKGIMTFITSALGTFALTQAVLTFDWVTFLTFIIVVLMGVVMGIITMKKVEIYWTEEYYLYALSEREKQEHDTVRKRAVPESGRAGSEESA